MLSSILPITNPSSPSPPKMTSSSVTAGTMFIRSEDEDDYYVPLTRISVSSFDEDDSHSHSHSHSQSLQVKPLLPRSSSFNSFKTRNASKFYHPWRRRNPSESALPTLSGAGDGHGGAGDGRGQSVPDDVAEVASNTYRITTLSLTLLRYLGL